MIALSALGTVGICLYSVPRIFFALASDGLFFRSFTAIHPRFRTPANAILFQTAWSIFLLLFWGRSPTSSLTLSSRTFCLWPWWG